MPRSPWAALAALLLLAPPQAHADAGRTSPGIVLDTGARHSAADGVAFSPDGSELFAWGEDKVIRRWPVVRDGFGPGRPAGLRWPIFRDRGGSVFALAFSPDGRRLAVGGFGIKPGLVAVIARDGTAGSEGATPATLPSAAVNWSVAWSPDGKHVVYGNDDGQVFRWTPGSRAAPTPFSARTPENPVRLLAFTGKDTFLSVAADGVVRRWSVSAPGRATSEVARLTIPNIFRAVLSPNGRWLAAAGTAKKNTAAERDAIGAVELIDLRSATPRPVRIKVPQDGAIRAVRCLAFDSASGRLAVGTQEAPAELAKGGFFRVIGGAVYIRDLAGATWGTPIKLGYRADAVAFHPSISNVLATAGGDDHEVTLWSAATGRPLRGTATIRGPGNCVWGVGFSPDGKRFAWQGRRAASPKGENDWGGGPWRVFDIARHEIRPAAPAGFKPVAPVNESGGWSVRPTDTAGVWEVAGPDGARVRLEGGDGSIYNNRVNQEPRCWTFLPAGPGRPLRLAVGHMWGLSVYEIRGRTVRLWRVLNGHEGEVMAVAPSADGKLLLSGGRDQTVCCWSLVPLKAGNEMGATFAVRGGKLVVTSVDNGSPAWEAFNPLKGFDAEQTAIPDARCALRVGDEIDFLMVRNESFVYDPAGLYASEVKKGHVAALEGVKLSADAGAALARLSAIRPHQQYILGKRVGGKGPVVYKLTTVKQQPLWRFFSTRADTGREWVIWRPRDFYYDTSANGDRYVGWHVNDPNPAIMPAFHPLERYRGTDRVGGGAPNGFHRKDKVWPELLDPAPVFARPVFTEIEAPRVRVRITKLPSATSDLEAEVTAEPPDGQQLSQRVVQAVVCINDTEFKGLTPDKAGRISEKVTIPRARLRAGVNTVTVRTFNEVGGRGEGAASVRYTPETRPGATLHAVCVGINNYDSGDITDLGCSVTDAAEMEAVLRQHKKSGKFEDANVVRVPQARATRAEILATLVSAAGRARPDDWIVVYLSGHGACEKARDARGALARGPDGRTLPRPGTYFYPCRGYDEKKPSTRLTSRDLFAALAQAQGRKLVILDTCHSGGAAVTPADQARDVSRDGMRFHVIASCQTDQKALEPGTPGGRFRHGFFTHALLDIVGPARTADVGKRLRGIPLAELQSELPTRLASVLAEAKIVKGGPGDAEPYQPAFLLPGSGTLEVLHKAGK